MIAEERFKGSSASPECPRLTVGQIGVRIKLSSFGKLGSITMSQKNSYQARAHIFHKTILCRSETPIQNELPVQQSPEILLPSRSQMVGVFDKQVPGYIKEQKTIFWPVLIRATSFSTAIIRINQSVLFLVIKALVAYTTLKKHLLLSRKEQGVCLSSYQSPICRRSVLQTPQGFS